MVLDDNQMEEGNLAFPSPCEVTPQLGFQDQLRDLTSGFDMSQDYSSYVSDFNFEDFQTQADEGNELFTETDAEFGLGTPEPKNAGIPSAQPATQEEGVVTATADTSSPLVSPVSGLRIPSPPLVLAPAAEIATFSLSFPPAPEASLPTNVTITGPQTPRPIQAVTGGLSFPQGPTTAHEPIKAQLTMLNSGFPDFGSVSSSPVDINQPTIAPGQTTTNSTSSGLVAGRNINDEIAALFQPEQNAVPLLRAAEAAQQPIYAPQPHHPKPIHQIMSTIQPQVPAVPVPGYVSQPSFYPTQTQNTISMPVAPVPTNRHPAPPVYPTFQQPPAPIYATPGPPAPPRQPRQPAHNHLLPDPPLYPDYGSASSDRSAFKRRRDDTDDEKDSPQPRRQIKKIRHRRDNNRRASNDPKLRYRDPSPQSSWGPFKYTPEGEWVGNVLYTADELTNFLLGPYGDGRAPSRKEKLTLWLQCRPAFEAHRYGPDASICRYKNCPMKKNTILKGQWRVAFDERASQSGDVTDPYRVAGYMHLYCFEEVFELFTLMLDEDGQKKFKVCPDTRVFRYEERNPMALDSQLVDKLNTWSKKQNQRYWNCVKSGQDFFTPPPQRLWRVLTEDLINRPGYIDKLSKNDFHIGKYKGDLRVYQSHFDQKVQDDREARLIDFTREEEYEDTHSKPTMSHGRHMAPLPARTGSSRRPSTATSRPRRPTLPVFTPPGRRKHTRAMEEYPDQSSPAKRYRVDTDRVQEHIEQVPFIASPPRRPSMARYVPLGQRRRSKEERSRSGQSVSRPQERRPENNRYEASSARSPPRRPDQGLYTPPNRRKRTRDDNTDSSDHQASCAKRPRVDPNQVKKHLEADLQQKLDEEKNKEVESTMRRSSKLLIEMVPDLSEVPNYKQWDVKRFAAREADKVRSGVERRWASVPKYIGTGKGIQG